ncbi:hypothetical protein M2132_000881 [Dysgonomonas sp. PH5-45]|uniref:hypothetical protein n=1 Tax=unclassified Dysgonomonas TaxID=2630389 RepID=UPI0024771C55|nr:MULTISPECIES: hypothetical protein [unclassified Dysgonomonas]MDH6354553.1 hypothetical protein [Dysgonomonas sp. PH5-45]MDH6387391.1 hypothetical protein [Dysgonomonas sp. PH5-37]
MEFAEFTYFTIVLGIVVCLAFYTAFLVYAIEKVFDSSLITKEEVKKYTVISCVNPAVGLFLLFRAEDKKQKECQENNN